METEYLFHKDPRNVKPIHTKNRNICTALPVPESMEIIERSIKNEPYL